MLFQQVIKVRPIFPGKLCRLAHIASGKQQEVRNRGKDGWV